MLYPMLNHAQTAPLEDGNCDNHPKASDGLMLAHTYFHPAFGKGTNISHFPFRPMDQLRNLEVPYCVFWQHMVTLMGNGGKPIAKAIPGGAVDRTCEQMQNHLGGTLEISMCNCGHTSRSPIIFSMKEMAD